MGLVTWLVTAGRDTVGQVPLIWMITGVIGFGPFHHALLGTTEVLSAMFMAQDASIGQFGHFLLWTTLETSPVAPSLLPCSITVRRSRPVILRTSR